MLVSINICYNIYVLITFNFFWDMLNFKTIKVGCIGRCAPIITIHLKNTIQRVPFDLHLSRFITYAPTFILGNLFPEQTPLNLGLF